VDQGIKEVGSEDTGAASDDKTPQKPADDVNKSKSGFSVDNPADTSISKESGEVEHKAGGSGSSNGGGGGSETQELLEQQNAFILREKLDLTAERPSMQGPIIALSLGLAFTFILLVLVACRLRTVRHRLRKGRPLHSNEADYLINGMYL
jgi:hypothetical protein